MIYDFFVEAKPWIQLVTSLAMTLVTGTIKVDLL